jgi:hypothetical protein
MDSPRIRSKSHQKTGSWCNTGKIYMVNSDHAEVKSGRSRSGKIVPLPGCANAPPDRGTRAAGGGGDVAIASPGRFDPEKAG